MYGLPAPISSEKFNTSFCKSRSRRKATYKKFALPQAGSNTFIAAILSAKARNVSLIFFCKSFFFLPVAALSSAFIPYLLPFFPQRSHKHRFNDQKNIVFAGVMCAELRAFAWVKSAFKECAEDGRF